MLRVISELRPAWVVGENVAGIVNMALDQVYADLENEGYAVQALIIPACAVDAPHRRDRVCIVGWKRSACNLFYSNSESAEYKNIGKSEKGKQEQPRVGGLYTDVSDTDHGSRSLRGNWELPAVEETRGQWTNHGGRTPEYVTGEWWPTEPGLGGVATRIPYRLDGGMSVPGSWMPEPDIPRITSKKEHRKDRLQCLGNAVVPQQFYPVFQAIADIERGIVHG